MISDHLSLGPRTILAVAALVSCLLATIGAARAEDSDRSFLLNAVAINQNGSRSGAGIYLGKRFVLTASHVVGRAVSVTIAGRELPAHVIKKDSFEQTDLALLAVDLGQLPISLKPKQISLCAVPALPGEDVVTVVPEGVVHSHILSPVWLPLDARKYSTVISDVARTGNSGSGVFAAKDKCLLGIMSRKITETFDHRILERTATIDIAKYFVPASVIIEFLPRGVLERESVPSAQE